MLVFVVLSVGLGGLILGFAGGFIVGLAKSAARAILCRAATVARGGTS